MTAIEIAHQLGSYITKFLIEKGAIIPADMLSLLPTSETNHAQALTVLFTELHALATNTDNLSDEKKEALLHLIQNNTYILTWQLEKNGFSFIFLAFHVNHVPVIKELVQLPEWKALSQKKTTKMAEHYGIVPRVWATKKTTNI